ncbi:hypothetical protein T11_11676 [Trichinella zimbabwensis]|uniref:Uncharacterized protein n=1 Tax=Trichinella zimbabwensis TaxID=268475 RepID=A0A0V1HH12_9BILA|nr:hypothetical protein T11_11676 [Trichinella zimbabwensis]
MSSSYHMIIYRNQACQASNSPLSTRVVAAKRKAQKLPDINSFLTTSLQLAELKMRATGTIRPYHTNGAVKIMLPDKELMKEK